MIVLDTNVISEPLTLNPNKAVMNSLDAQALDVLYTTAVNISELFYGVGLLASSKRKSKLLSDLSVLVESRIGPRILPFDFEAAEFHLELLLDTRAAGYTLSANDSVIAAIARSRGYSAE